MTKILRQIKLIKLSKISNMNGQKHNKIVNFIWSIADDVLRDVFVRKKYRDIILPFTVIRKIDALLEPTKTGGVSAYEFLKKRQFN